MYINNGRTLTDMCAILDLANSTLLRMQESNKQLFGLHDELIQGKWSNEGYARWCCLDYREGMEQGLLVMAKRHIVTYIGYIDNYESALDNIHMYKVKRGESVPHLRLVISSMQHVVGELVFKAQLIARESDPGINSGEAHNTKLSIDLPNWVEL